MSKQKSLYELWLETTIETFSVPEKNDSGYKVALAVFLSRGDISRFSDSTVICG